MIRCLTPAALHRGLFSLMHKSRSTLTLIDARRERSGDFTLSNIGESFDYPLIVNA